MNAGPVVTARTVVSDPFRGADFGSGGREDPKLLLVVVGGVLGRVGRWARNIRRAEGSPKQVCARHSIASIWPGWDGPDDFDIIQKTPDADQRLLQMLPSCASKHNPWLSENRK